MAERVTQLREAVAAGVRRMVGGARMNASPWTPLAQQAALMAQLEGSQAGRMAAACTPDGTMYFTVEWSEVDGPDVVG